MPSPSFCSLPLMGIGNPGNPGVQIRVINLITPHGDRKRECRTTWARGCTSHYPSWGSETIRASGLELADGPLITPHGDRKRHHLTVHHLTMCHSLPLMGIGNLANRSYNHGRFEHSLPLMGIGNARRWGRPRRGTALITPHGDRKRALESGLVSRSRNSLPLMGIGNFNRGRRRVVTPVDSLPLMGIGNHALILSTQRPLSTHYPSWGSETAVTSPSRSIRTCSLPLMGIGNRRYCPWDRRWLLTHYPSWGSETSDGLQDGHVTVDLITPHGDRKR